ncbi:MAG: hypothetical protein SP1CHLAM54_04060 [Chlamydiia bacterium]|nr:hypothetical protein [Chlamydiia bacterium]MCH9615321.1 hypothetical protein [Chlamydiia bacterium]MCH9628357.1 hypothetical protein [Chlamydiia bacterium]
MLPNLRIPDVSLFLTAAKLESLGKAAKRHHLSQGAASSAIVRLEEALGISLTYHEKRKFRLTREGELIIPRLEEWLRQLESILSSKEKAPLRVVTTHGLAAAFVPELFKQGPIDLKLMRPDKAYAAVVSGEADQAIVLDNAPWEGVIAKEIGVGQFGLVAKKPPKVPCPVLLPEDQLEVLNLCQKYKAEKGAPLQIKARIPSWTLIADLCAHSDEVGFLPDFLFKRYGLRPVTWQSEMSHFRILSLTL